MSEVSVADAAAILHVSPGRVRQLVDAGSVRARKVGGHWLVDPSSLHRLPAVSRPMSTRMAWAMIVESSGGRADWISPRERFRLRQQLGGLAGHPHPERVIASWLAARAERLTLEGHAPTAVADDARVHLSGVSDSRSHMVTSNFVEGYVHQDHLRSVLMDHGLVPGRPGWVNTVLHVAPRDPGDPVPLLAVIADLVEYGPGREHQAACDLAAQAVAR